MEVGLGALGLPPETFWGLTVRELAALCAGRWGGRELAPLGRAELAELMAKFPDV